MKFYLLLIAFIFLNSSLISCQEKEKEIITSTSYIIPKENKKPKNIILLIGDGMGLSQISLAQFYQETPSNFERFPVIGLTKTSSGTHLITDSGAAGTAISSGVKAIHKSVGIDKSYQPTETIIELASKNGFSTGIVVTSSITNATPASFYSHNKSRYENEEIAESLLKSEIDFFAGGGLNFFNKRKDSINLLTEFGRLGYQVDTLNLPLKTSKKKNAIILSEIGMPKMSEGRGNFLSEAMTQAFNKLSLNNKGFFLMVEGSQIDWAGHDMDIEYLIKEQLDFDKTIGVALDFAIKNGETLVIVTADHETGAFALAMEDNDYNKIIPTFYSDDHSATMVPVFAFGPGSEIFGGVYENTEIHTKMKSLLFD